jgi:hypothetical protein
MNEFKFPLAVKAEPLINTYLDYNSDIRTVQVNFNGSFQRNYLNDVFRFDMNGKSTADNKILKVSLNRDGIYDKLPEGFFHEIDRFVRLGSNGNQKAFKEEYEKQKNEIEYSRKFFQPFDSLFFDLALQIDKMFTRQSSNVQRTVYDFFFTGDKNFKLSDFHLHRVVPFLPYFSKIRANIHHMKFFLSYLFDTDVLIEQIESLRPHYYASHSYNILDQAYLSRNMYCGNHYFDFSFEWKIIIKSAESRLFKLVEDSDFKQLYDFIICYLIPAGVQTLFRIKSHTLTNIELQQGAPFEKRQYLGINITI